MNRRSGTTYAQVMLAAAIFMLLSIFAMYIVFPIFACACKKASKKAASAQNTRQMALAGIMYGGDFDDRIPVTTNGWLSRMQNIADKELTVDAPAPGTQDLPAKSAGAARTDAWPTLVMPYLKSRGLFVNPSIVDKHKIWAAPAKTVSDADYDPEGATYRNQNRFPYYGMNYMFLSQLRIPKDKRHLPDAVNYAVSVSHRFTDADDPSGTVFFTESQRSLTDQSRGFFVVNAPGMWQSFATNKDGYVAFWGGTAGSGDWVGTETACANFETPCSAPIKSTNYVYTGFNSGCNAAFLDGHVKYYRAAALAAGTDFLTAKAGSQGHLGSGAKIIDKSKYLWNLSAKDYGF